MNRIISSGFFCTCLIVMLVVAVLSKRNTTAQNSFLREFDFETVWKTSHINISGSLYESARSLAPLTTAFRPIPNIAVHSTYTRNQFCDLSVESAGRNVDLVNITFRRAINPRLQLAGSLQHNTNQRLNLVNLRFSWEFSPLSYLYLVFNDVHPFGDDLDMRPPGQQQAIFKLTYLTQL